MKEYGEGIKITGETWDKIEAAGGEKISPTVENKSDATIYYMPEGKSKVDGTNLNPGYPTTDGYPIAPQTDLYAPADAVAAPNVKEGAIYKMVDGVSVTVTNSNIESHSSGFKSAIGQMLTGGWLYDRRTTVQPPQGAYGWGRHIPVSPNSKGWDNLVDKSYKKR